LTTPSPSQERIVIRRHPIISTIVVIIVLAVLIPVLIAGLGSGAGPQHR